MEDNQNVNAEQTASEAVRDDAEQAKAAEAPEKKRGLFGGKKKKEKKTLKGEIMEWITSLAVAVLVVVVLQSFLFRVIRVDGQSMETTLHNGERLFVTVYDVKFQSVDRNDIVICHYPDRGMTYFVKRVVAVPGDTVYRQSGVTHVVYEQDGQTVDEALDPDAASLYLALYDYEPYTLGEDEYFCVGDNRYNSNDSRNWHYGREVEVGPVKRKMIVGHVRSVFWPLDSIRSVE